MIGKDIKDATVGIVGLGGLGHMAVKLAKAMGAEVTVFSTSPSKEADAKKLGGLARRIHEQLVGDSHPLAGSVGAARHDVAEPRLSPIDDVEARDRSRL